MKEKEQAQNSNGVSKAIIIAFGIILLLSACGNMTQMIFGPIIDEVAREVESDIEKDIFAELEREFESLEKELHAVETELEAVDQELNGVEIKLDVVQHDPSTFEIKIQQEVIEEIQNELQPELEVGR